MPRIHDQPPRIEPQTSVADRLVVPPAVARSLAVPPEFEERRRFARRRYTTRALVQIEQSLPTVPRESGLHVIITKDLSRCGIEFFHSEQLYPGEQIVLWLPTGMHSAVVVRCLQHGAQCFEVGAQFA